MTTTGATQSNDASGVPRQHPRRYRPAFVPGLSAAILLFIAVFWLFLAMRLQEVDLNQPPAWWLAQVESFPLLAFVPTPFVTFISELLSWRVLRHVLIPTLLGWWLAGEAAAGFVHSFYNFSSRAAAADFLGRLQSHGRAKSVPGSALVSRPAGRTRLGPALRLAMIMTPMALTFLLLLLISPLLPPSPSRSIIYNALIVISGAVTVIAVVYFAIDAFSGGAVTGSPGLSLNRESLESMRREHALLRVGGPGKIVVPNNEVAVTEYNARFYRVLGPGVQTLSPFEYVRTMLDLRPQDREGDVTGITQDGVEVACHIAVTFRLSSDDRYMVDDDGAQPAVDHVQRPTRDRPYPFGERAVRTAAYIETVDGERRVASWTSLPLVVATGQFRRALTLFPLDTLYDPDGQGSPPHPELWKIVHNETRDALRNSGIELIGLRMGPLQPPQSVMEQNLSGWRSYWEKHLHRRQVEGRVEAAYTVEDARTRAAVEMLRTIMHSIQHARRESSTEMTQEIMALRLLEALERVAQAAEEASKEEDPQVQRRLEAIRKGLLPPGSASRPIINE